MNPRVFNATRAVGASEAPIRWNDTGCSSPTRQRGAHSMSNTTMTEAIHDLVSEWTDVVDTKRRKNRYQAVDHGPLLVTLRDQIRSSSGGTTPGASSDHDRNVINLEAFALWERITHDVRMLTKKHTKDRANPLLGYAVRSLAGKLDALWASHQILESDYLHAVGKARAWRAQIWALLHKPREKELADSVCPNCEQSKAVNEDGEQQSALVAYYQQGTEPTAKCRHCGWLWEGEAALIVLGKMIGANLDVETLEEMGVI